MSQKTVDYYTFASGSNKETEGSIKSIFSSYSPYNIPGMVQKKWENQHNPYTPGASKSK